LATVPEQVATTDILHHNKNKTISELSSPWATSSSPSSLLMAAKAISSLAASYLTLTSIINSPVATCACGLMKEGK
jgi:hypothetical protein